MKHTHLSTIGAAAFALVAITVSSTSVYKSYSPSTPVLVPPMLSDGRLFTAQTATISINEFTPDQSAQGIVLPKDTHNFFRCTTGGNMSIEANSLGDVRTWMYEFTGNEPPFNGEFFISAGEIAANSKYDAMNTLQTFSTGKRYYQMGQVDMYFKCDSGLSRGLLPVEVCGDGIVSDTEECDDGNSEDHDGCSQSCTTEVGYRCESEPSNCTQIIPMLPSNTSNDTVAENTKNAAPEDIDTTEPENTDDIPTTIQECMKDDSLYWDVTLNRCSNAVQTCADPDSLGKEGDDILTQSSAFGFLNAKGNPFDKRFRKEAADFCATDTVLIEYSCEERFLKENIVTCPSGSCIDGHCTEADPPDPNEPTPYTNITSVINGNGASSSYSIPFGNNSTIGRFSFITKANDDSATNKSIAALDDIIFTVDALNVSMYSYGAKVYNTTNPSIKAPCDIRTRNGSLIGNSVVSNNRFEVLCPNLIDSPVETSVEAGGEITLALEASITTPIPDPSRPSTLRVSLRNFTDKDSIFGIGVGRSHIHWVDTYENMSQGFDWINHSSPTVSSTLFQYRRPNQTSY